jgi:hypothetical protein
MSSKTTKHCVFTHFDLDGAVTYLVLKWFYPHIEFDVITVRNVFEFREQYLAWCLNNKPTDYEQIFILDLDVSGNEDLIDKPNFFIVDHHETHLKSNYKVAKAYIKKYSSAAKLLYKILQTKFPSTDISKPKKILIGLADDYDSYTLKNPLSKLLNILFWNYNNSFTTFCEQFAHGMKGFTPEQMSIIKFYSHSFKKYKENIKEIYLGTLTFKNKQYSVCSFLADKYINDLSDEFFKLENTDIIIMMKPTLKKTLCSTQQK